MLKLVVWESQYVCVLRENEQAILSCSYGACVVHILYIYVYMYVYFIDVYISEVQ